MPINSSLGDLSNGLLLVTVVLYALAMLCYASDFAFARHRVMAGLTETTVAEVAVPELVAAGSGGPASSVTAGPPPVTSGAGEPVSRWPSGFWLRLAFGLTCVGLTTHLLAIFVRGIAEHRTPWGNMYEFIAAFTCMAVLVLVVASVWARAYYMGLFVMIPIVFGLGVDLTVLYTPPGSLLPALQSY